MKPLLAWGLLLAACTAGHPPPRLAERKTAAETIRVEPAGALPPSSREELRAAAAALQRLIAPAAQDCYQRVIRRVEEQAIEQGKPQDAAAAQGVVVIAFAVGAGGELSGAHVAESEVLLPGLDECLIGLFAGKRLDARGPEEIEMPFRFALKGPE
jgi:hypothetical protein